MGFTTNTNTAFADTDDGLTGQNETPSGRAHFSTGARFASSVEVAEGAPMQAALQRVIETSATVARLTSFLQAQGGVLKYVGTVLERLAEAKASGGQAGAGAELTVCQAELTSAAALQYARVALFGGYTLTIHTSQVALPSIVISQSHLAPAIAAVLAASDLSGLTMPALRAAISAVAALRAQNDAEAERLKEGGTALAISRTNLEKAQRRAGVGEP